MKETLKNSDIDSIIPCGGGIETAAELPGQLVKDINLFYLQKF